MRGEGMKVCSKCGIELSLDNFHKNKGNKDGMSGSCKGCANERSKAWVKANAKRVKANGKKWYEANLERTKATSRAWYLANTEKHKATSSARYRENPERVNTAARIWNKANPEKAKSTSKKWYESNSEWSKAAARAWYEANPEQAKATAKAWSNANHEKTRQYTQGRKAIKRSLTSSLTVTQWEEIKQHFNNACCYCGEEKTLHQEHFLALSKGGEYTHNNIVPACKSCNSSKNNNTFFEWYPKYKHYSKKRGKLILDYLGYHNTTQQLSIL